jgi:hypothetical protein
MDDGSGLSITNDGQYGGLSITNNGQYASGRGIAITSNNGDIRIYANSCDQSNVPLHIYYPGGNQALAIDANGNTIIGSGNGEQSVLRPQSQPSAPQTGGMYYDSTTNLPYIWNGSAWVAFLASSGFTAAAIEALLGISSTNVTALANLTGSNTGDQTLPTLTSLGAVPTSRQVNGKALSANITLDCDDLSDGTNTHLVTTAQKTVIGNTSGTNTGDQVLPTVASLFGASNPINQVVASPASGSAGPVAARTLVAANIPALPYATQSKSFVLTNPTSSTNGPIWRAPYAITIIAVHALCVDGTNIVGQLWEYDGNGTSGSTCGTDLTATQSGGNVDSTTFTNPGIALGNYLGWKTTSVSGPVTKVIVTYEYTID